MNKNIKPIIGLKFGKLLVIKLSPKRAGLKKETVYHCLCDCGKKKKVLGCNLRAGRVSSCGCLTKTPPNKNKNRRLALIKRLYSSMRSNGRNNKKGFDLSFNVFCLLISSDCFYCGEAPSNTLKDVNKFGLISQEELKYSGIDRANDNEGYTNENCVPCCKICNFCKGSMNKESFLSHIAKISHFRKL
jgi:hypothetical protein